jgi:ArsR family transcriptional regulator
MGSKDSHLKDIHDIDSAKIKSIRRMLPDPSDLDNMSRFFGLLADPTRLKIVLALKSSELCVHEIADVLGMSLSAISHQLRLLKTANLVKNRRAGKMIYYALDDEHIEQLLLITDSHIREE